MAFLDDLGNSLASNTTDVGKDIFAIILSYTYVIAILGLVIFGTFAILRALKRYGEYAGHGIRLGAYNLSLMDGTHVTGNLSKDDFFTEEMFEKLKIVEKKFNISFEEFRKLVLDGIIFIYDFRITDHSKAWTLTNIRDIKIVSMGKMESDSYSWQDQKGRFSFTGAGFKEFPRNVFGWKGSSMKKIINPFGKEIDSMYIELIPREEAVKIMADVGVKQISININRISQSESILKAVENLPVIIKMYSQFEIDSQELRITKDLLDAEHKAHSTTNAKLNRAKHLLTEKIFVGYGKPLTPIEKGIEWAWIIGSYWLGYIGIKQMSPSFPNVPEWVIPVGIFVIILAIRQLMEKRKPIEEQLNEKEGKLI